MCDRFIPASAFEGSREDWVASMKAALSTQLNSRVNSFCVEQCLAPESQSCMACLEATGVDKDDAGEVACGLCILSEFETAGGEGAPTPASVNACTQRLRPVIHAQLHPAGTGDSSGAIGLAGLVLGALALFFLCSLVIGYLIKNRRPKVVGYEFSGELAEATTLF